jgi:hypothetical protein
MSLPTVANSPGKLAKSFRQTRHAERHYWPNGDVLRGLPSRPAQGAWNVLAPDELVLGVTVGKEARAYPLNVLDDYIEQNAVNDTLGGQPILIDVLGNCPQSPEFHFFRNPLRRSSETSLASVGLSFLSLRACCSGKSACALPATASRRSARSVAIWR